MARATMFFPSDFLWGTVTSAHQVEGQNENNDWWLWEQEDGHIVGNVPSGLACDWWRSAEADLDRAAEMGTNAHRLSLEWSRIEPEPSVFDDDSLGRYREILQGMRDRGIEPMVTLHHFTNPLWLVEKGDFNTEVIVDYFRRYTAKVADTLGNLIPKWLTIHEPLTYVIRRYFQHRFPEPAEYGKSAGMRALRHMLLCHAAAYHTIKEAYPHAAIGVAQQYRPMEPLRAGNLLDAWWARRLSWFYNHLWMASLSSGRLRRPVGRGTVKDLAGTFDFVGVDYFSSAQVRFPRQPGRLSMVDAVAELLEDNDDGFEVFPEGLFAAIKATLSWGKPIYITENGLPDASDKLRPAFLLTYLREIWRAISFNFPIMGYYYGSLIDKFEWDRGWLPKWGLIEVDRATQERRWRPSARMFSEICHTRSISSDMAERYAPSILASMFPGERPSPRL